MDACLSFLDARGVNVQGLSAEGKEPQSNLRGGFSISEEKRNKYFQDTGLKLTAEEFTTGGGGQEEGAFTVAAEPIIRA